MANVIPPNAVDLAGLSDLRRRAERNDPSALADVAVQFEALFIGMMLDSARSASLGGGLFDGPETEQYLSLMDRQVALELAKSGGFGFATTLREQLSARGGVGGVESSLHVAPRAPTVPAPAVAPPVAEPIEPVAPAAKPTPAEFVTALLPDAKAAGAALGVEPRLLLAQAALETGWGAAAPQRDDGEPAHNLFGIKAGASWSGPAVEHWTLEHTDGAFERVRAPFRSYASTAESFADYVNLIASSRRYAGALENAADPEAYARSVTEAGYATDPKYADKWLAIYHGDRLEHALRGIDK